MFSINKNNYKLFTATFLELEEVFDSDSGWKIHSLGLIMSSNII